MNRKYFNYKLIFDKYILSFLIIFLFFSGKYILNYSWEFIIEHFSKGIFSFYFKTLYRNAAIGYGNYFNLGIYCFFIIALVNYLFDGILWKKNKNNGLVESYFLKKYKFLHIIISSIIILVVVFMFISYSVSRELCLSFQQKIKILKPFIEEPIQDILCSKWASMESYSEYKEIEINLRKTFKENNIKYPISYFSFKLDKK